MGELELERENDVDIDCRGPELLEREIEKAIEEMKKGKMVGIDGIPAEFWQCLKGQAKKELVRLCKDIYEKGVWPEDFTKTVMIPIPKTVNAVECSDYRTISLIPHASKIVLKVVTKRIESKATEYISRTQFGFRKGLGTRDAIGVMRMLIERSLEHDNDIYICFVDFEKAFDRVNWKMMMRILKEVGVDWRDRRLVAEMYMKQEVMVRIDEEYTEPSIIGRGVRQGCLMSPLLFSMYAEAMMKEAMEGVEEGVKVGGQVIQDVRFADDQGMVASTEVGLQRIMDRLTEVACRYGMKINVKKTKVMRVSRKGGEAINIVVEGHQVEQVKKFRYLGVQIADDGKCEAEIRVRIAMAKEAFYKRKELLTNSLKRDIKKKIVKTIVWTVALYGAETWTLKEEDIRRLNALEMWIWRRMEKISWTDKKTNEEVLRMVGEKQQLVDRIITRKKNWLGHVMRGEGLLKEVIEGRMDGKRPRGRKRKGMLDCLIGDETYQKIKRMAQDRELWRCWLPRTCRQAENQ